MLQLLGKRLLTWVETIRVRHLKPFKCQEEWEWEALTYPAFKFPLERILHHLVTISSEEMDLVVRKTQQTNRLE